MTHEHTIKRITAERDEAILQRDNYKKRLDNITGIIDNIDSVAQVSEELHYTWSMIYGDSNGWCYKIRQESSV
jgi:hypothetical protein